MFRPMQVRQLQFRQIKFANHASLPNQVCLTQPNPGSWRAGWQTCIGWAWLGELALGERSQTRLKTHFLIGREYLQEIFATIQGQRLPRDPQIPNHDFFKIFRSTPSLKLRCGWEYFWYFGNPRSKVACNPCIESQTLRFSACCHHHSATATTNA